MQRYKTSETLLGIETAQNYRDRSIEELGYKTSETLLGIETSTEPSPWSDQVGATKPLKPF